MKEKYDIVVVEWEDAQSSLENYELIDLLAIEPVMTCSCGYLINKNKDRITLSTMIFGGRIFKHHQTIPTKMIKSFKKLGETEVEVID